MTPNNPLVSILVVNWNGASYIEQCLRSLVGLQYGNYEIIVIDNDSVDDSVNIIKSHFPQVRIVANSKNFGFARACNIGFKTAKGNLIALFNSDAIADKKWLRELVSALSSSKNAGAAGGPIFYLDPPNKVWFNGGRIDGVTGFSWHLDQNKFHLSRVEDFDTLSGCAMLIKREVFEGIGFMDEGYFLYSDDVDLSISVRRMRLNLLFVPLAICWHMVSAGKKKVPLFTYQMKAKCDLRMILKNYPLKYIPSALLFKGLLHPLSEALYFYKDPRFLPINLGALFNNMRDLRSTMKARRLVERLGEARIQNRFGETINAAVQRIKEVKLYW